MLKLDKAFREELKENWVLLAAAFSCLLFGLSVGAFALPFLYPEVIDEFGWTREQASILASAKYLATSLAAVLGGMMVDRIGIWRSLLSYMLIAGAALLSFLWTVDLTAYYLSGIGLGLAAGGGMVSVKILVAKSFHRSQGTAMGVALLGTGIGATIVPIVATFAISHFGWRMGFAVMSVPVWLLAIPLLLLAASSDRRRSAQVAAQSVSSPSPTINQDQATLRDIVRDGNFWLIASAGFLAALVDTAFTQHQVLILRDLDLPNATIAIAISAMGLIGVGARVLVGNILDSKSNKGLAGLYATLTIGALLSLALGSPVVLGAFVLFRAVGHAAILLDTGVMPKHVFGSTQNLGTLMGLFTGASSLGFATGPWLMGRLYDMTNAYTTAYVLFAVLPVVAMILAWNIKPRFWLSLNARHEAAGAKAAPASAAADAGKRLSPRRT
ncbi:MAG: MFS transporter [Phenylobacterium sp.]|uniref:MFS transporter n=1 Tax=Phenylobacterium sp. TaxID=1871053 RepID=UPI001A18229B|nr:MFS transporter [Phenylobacterium sp.]MBJ7412059.1 MFS transporter [Phenylobacterium sp.]